MSASPKVTVFIPVYNRAKYVSVAIDSILAQSFTDFELLLIDDGSTDGSAEIVRSYTDPRVRLVCNEGNLGIPKTRNKGVQLARGEYFAVLDSDDYTYPHRLEKQVAFLDRHEDYAAVGSWTAAMDDKGRFLRRLRLSPVLPGDVRSLSLFRGAVSHSSVMARKAVLEDYGYRERFAVCSDFDLWVRVAGKHKIGNLPEVLVRRRMHGERITRKKAQLVKEKQLEIFGAQLTELGVTFSATDLERHRLLLYMGKSGFAPDHAYLEWAGAWLLKLQETNRRTRRYPEGPFARVMGEVWFQVCRRASAGLGWTAWRRFWQSPLSKWAWAALRSNLVLLAFRRPRWET
jgi:glycosyltransferase involved in cell wall biosynthesis